MARKKVVVLNKKVVKWCRTVAKNDDDCPNCCAKPREWEDQDHEPVFGTMIAVENGFQECEKCGMLLNKETGCFYNGTWIAYSGGAYGYDAGREIVTRAELLFADPFELNLWNAIISHADGIEITPTGVWICDDS